MNIQNSTAFVSGANRGIGKAIVESLLKNGAKKIYAAARDISTLSTYDQTLVCPVSLDVTEPHSIEMAVRLAGDVNVLINNAGVLDFGDILTVSEAQLKRNMDVNFYGTLSMARNFAPVIEHNQGGAIVNILTLLSLASMPGLAAYNASKAAAWSMSLSLRASLADKNITVQGVFPGAVDTDMLAGVEMPKTSPADVADAIVNGISQEQEDIFPDPMSSEVYAAWSQDHKAVEKQFAQM